MPGARMACPPTARLASLCLVQYVVTDICEQFQVDKAYILSQLGRDDFAIWDARSKAEYTGEKTIAARGGHIPGAVHYEWTAGMNPDQGLRINDLQQFDATLNQFGPWHR